MSDLISRLQALPDTRPEPEPFEVWRDACGLVLEAADEIERLQAEPQGEPVAWGVFVDDELFKPFNCKDEAVDWFQAQYNHGSRYDYLVLPLYTAPQQRKPPSDVFVYKVVRSVQPNLADTCKAWAEQFYECKYWLDAAHGITGEQE